MSEQLHSWRQGMKRLNGRAIGMKPEQPTDLVGQQRIQQNQDAIFALPVDVSQRRSLQVTSGADIGKLYFLPGVSIPGGGDVVR